jgi:hypothetical protein
VNALGSPSHFPPVSPRLVRLSLEGVSSPEPTYVRVNFGYEEFKMETPLELCIKDNPNGGGHGTRA